MIVPRRMPWFVGFRGRIGSRVEVGGVHCAPSSLQATMDADLYLLLTTVYVTADDLVPERPGNARRRVTDAEVVTLAVGQAIMGIPSDRRPWASPASA